MVRRGRLAGARTFALVALCGATAAYLDPWLVVAGLPVLGALMVVGYKRRSLTDPGTTTEVALLATYLLGAMTADPAALAAALAIAMAVLLVAKAPIHAFARDLVTELELEDPLKFLVLAFIVLPLLPDRDLGPYGAINPRRIWLIVVALTGISWVGYIAVRALGSRRGLLLTGLAGGFISASATTVTMARRARLTDTMTTPVAAALLASVATFVQLVGILAVAAPSVVAGVWPAAVAGGVVVAAIALVGYRNAPADDTRDTSDSTSPDDEAMTTVDRPFALRPALVLATILTGALLLGRWSAEVFGAKGAVLAVGAAGLADAHAGALAPATLHEAGNLDLATALVAVGAAVAANTVTKLAAAITAGGSRFGLRFAAGLVPGVAAFLAALVLAAIRT